MKKKRREYKRGKIVFWGVVILTAAVLLFYFSTPLLFPTKYKVPVTGNVVESLSDEPKEKPFVATHVSTPEPLKGVYMTSWVAGTPSLRQPIVNLINETELNAIVIDIKDDTGRVSYEVTDPALKEIGSEDIRIQDIRDFIERMHESDIYVIGRIAVFQDPYMTKVRPDLAVKRSSDGAVWRDRKGISWIDASAKEHWEYIATLAKDAYFQGFDEINFDYVRFPSDGNMSDIYYPHSGTTTKPLVIENFFKYLDEELRDSGMKISADLFGMTTTNHDDLNIGQLLENAFPYFDYIAPMVYPSHYPSGFYGIKNVNAEPYNVVKISMGEAVKRLETFNSTVASTTVQLRPWLQDNNYPVTYTPAMVRAQMQATYDVGLTSWMLWDAGNTYTRAALLPEEQVVAEEN